MEQLKQIHDVELQISVDATQAAFEFMRYPASWQQVDANIRKFKQELSQARINFNFVAQPLNIVHLVDSMLYANSVRIPMQVNNLLGPPWLNWSILTTQEKQQIADVVESQLDAPLAQKQKSQALSLLKTMKACDYLPDWRNEFRRRMASLVAHRKIADSTVRNHFLLVPSLADFIQHL